MSMTLAAVSSGGETRQLNYDGASIFFLFFLLAGMMVHRASELAGTSRMDTLINDDDE
jgi:hypothetical protein